MQQEVSSIATDLESRGIEQQPNKCLQIRRILGLLWLLWVDALKQSNVSKFVAEKPSWISTSSPKPGRSWSSAQAPQGSHGNHHGEALGCEKKA